VSVPEVERRIAILLDIDTHEGVSRMDRPGLDHDHPLRVFVLTEQPLIAEMVKLTLNHGVYITRDTKYLDDAWAIVT
jgi:hypothetical protein